MLAAGGRMVAVAETQAGCVSVCWGRQSTAGDSPSLWAMFLELNLALLPFSEPSWTECGIEVFRVVQMGDSFSVAGLR